MVVHVLFEIVEASGPEPAVSFEPHLDDVEPLGIDAVDPALCFGSHMDEPRVAQNLEVLRDRGLAQLKAIDEFANGSLAPSEFFDDGKPSVVCESCERLHVVTV
jgi:hypothetical protein